MANTRIVIRVLVYKNVADNLNEWFWFFNQLELPFSFIVFFSEKLFLKLWKFESYNQSLYFH